MSKLRRIETIGYIAEEAEEMLRNQLRRNAAWYVERRLAWIMDTTDAMVRNLCVGLNEQA